jgi:hypothetical protein
VNCDGPSTEGVWAWRGKPRPTRGRVDGGGVVGVRGA